MTLACFQWVLWVPLHLGWGVGWAVHNILYMWCAVGVCLSVDTGCVGRVGMAL